MITRVYRYGLLRPTENQTLVREQMRLAHLYRNTLTEIERGRRAALRAAMRAYEDVPLLEEAARAASEAELEAARKAKAAKSSAFLENEEGDSKAKSTTRVPEELRKVLESARQARREAVQAFRKRRAELLADPEVKAASDEINERAAELQRSAREYSGLYWGSYQLVEDAMQQARKAPLYDGAEPNDPGFVSWSDPSRAGHVSVQLQGGLEAPETMACRDTQLQIRTGLPAIRRKTGEPLTGKRAKHRAELKLRVGSDDKRQPIWAAWPMVLHRPLPDGSTVKRATVTVRRRGPREEWSCEMTLSMPDPAQVTGRAGAVAIDVGWRLMGEEIRVARWHGQDGKTGELRLNQRMIGGLRKAEELQAIRAERFNVIKLEFMAWLGKMGERVPEEIRKASRTLEDWRSQGRLAALVRKWRDNRFAGDDEGYNLVEAWRYKDHHLWAWEVNQRTGALRNRRHFYRQFAAQLSSRYDTVVFEDFDLRPMARKRPVSTTEEEKAENKTARSNRQLVAIYELRQAVGHAFRARGGKEEKVPAENTTRTCNVCGLVEAFDAATYVRHVCSGCGTNFDQDENAAANILALWQKREEERDAQKPDSSRDSDKPSEVTSVRETRWAKAKRLRQEKETRMEGARKASGKGKEG